MKISYYVRTTGERKLDSSYTQIKYAKLIDFEHKPVKSFIEQLEKISDEDSVLLEDDLILCNSFKTEIEQVISTYHDRIVNFFTLPRFWFMTREKEAFSYNQCTYYPKGVARKIAEMMKLLDNGKLPYDELEREALARLKIKHIQYRPCLVQHIDKHSLISVGSGRRSPYFIDYLKELHIDYNEASKLKNQRRLIEYMNNKFKEADE